MRQRSAIKRNLFGTESRAPKITSLDDPAVKIGREFEFAALAIDVDRVT